MVRGGFDIESFASFIGISGGGSWERTFHRKSGVIHDVILDLCDLILAESLKTELIATIRHELRTKYKLDTINSHIDAYCLGKYDDVPIEIQRIGISVSFDMGWQKRSTGRLYDSISGHGYLIGCRTNNMIAMGVKKKKCSICNKVNKADNVPVKAHKCAINWTGASGAMESSLALDLISNISLNSSNRIYVKDMVYDDDSTMRKHCQTKENGGKLPDGVAQPRFPADPSHRIKCMLKPIFKMVTNPPAP